MPARQYDVQPREMTEEVGVASSPDPPTFEAWVGAHADALTRFAVLVVGDRTEADDAVQEALSRAYPRWERIVRADDPAAYVRRMIVNAHVSWWRRVRKRESPVGDVHAPHPTHPSGPDLDLWALCLRLPPRQRAALVLRFYEGLAYAEIADVLGVAEVTARTQTHRALTALRAALTDPTYADPKGAVDE